MLCKIISHPSDTATGCKETQHILIKCLKPALFHLYTKVTTVWGLWWNSWVIKKNRGLKRWTDLTSQFQHLTPSLVKILVLKFSHMWSFYWIWAQHLCKCWNNKYLHSQEGFCVHFSCFRQNCVLLLRGSGCTSYDLPQDGDLPHWFHILWRLHRN